MRVHVAPLPRPNRSSVVRLFVALTVTVYLLEVLAVRWAHFGEHADALALAVTIDLTIVVPALYWLLVVRAKRAPLITLAGVFLASLAGAALVIPREHQQYLRLAEFLAFPVEIGVVWLIVRAAGRAAATTRSSHATLDVPEQIETTLAAMVRSSRLAAVLAMECSILYYAFASWRRRPFVPDGMRPFFYHVQSSLAATFGVLALASVGELVAVHFLLRTVSPRAAWTLTILSMIGVLWLVGFLRSAVLRPVLLSDTHLLVRTGLQWRLDIPLADIEHVTIGRVAWPAPTEDSVLRAVRFGQPNVCVTLRTPAVARGAYGSERVVTRVLLTLDDRRAFETALGRKT